MYITFLRSYNKGVEVFLNVFTQKRRIFLGKKGNFVLDNRCKFISYMSYFVRLINQ